METDYLIVGAGIAGISLALELHLAGADVCMVDQADPASSSRNAAGMLNPIVPKRITTTWLGEDIFPGIGAWYEKIAAVLGANFYHPFPLHQIHPQPETARDWQKSVAAGNPFLAAGNDPIPDAISAPWGYTKIRHAGRVDMPGFIESAANFFAQRNCLIQEDFEYEKLGKDAESGWNYKHLHARKIIFCEGARGTENPWFGGLPFQLSSGDILTLKIPALSGSQVIWKRSKWLIPIGQDIFLAGSTFRHENPGPLSKNENKDSILADISGFVKGPLSVMNHSSARRPTVRDRRPFIGEHPIQKGMYIFNGLGTKGASLVTLLAPALKNHLIFGTTLPEETSIVKWF